ncbi:alpha/beta fold hydrolase [Streptomyces cyaneofuscatus]|uniref:alpha/beta fold hydrolase n=1 Tax=Streptomyces cyaneofuscatus TaxID=66883 RepID=UPI0038083684
MTTPAIPGFTEHRVSVDNGVTLKAAVGGSGTPVVLLHGFPQTHLMWRHVAADLAADHTVICPDLRGYGSSDKPVESGPDVYSKRTMARDVVRLAAALGHDRFTLGAWVSIRRGVGPGDLEVPDAFVFSAWPHAGCHHDVLGRDVVVVGVSFHAGDAVCPREQQQPAEGFGGVSLASH